MIFTPVPLNHVNKSFHFLNHITAMHFKSIQLFYLILPLAFFVFTSCEKDSDPNEDTNNQIQGEWDVKSWTLDGVEQMDFTVNTFEMDFKKESGIGGETDWLIIFTDGSTTRIDGDYEIQNDGREIDVDGDDLNIDIDRDNMDMSGNIDGRRWEIEAEKS